MSDFLDGLLRRGRAPVPEAVRPLPRMLFEPEASRAAGLEPAATSEAVEKSIGSPNAHSDLGARDDSRPRSRPTAPRTPQPGVVEQAPTAPGTPIPVGRQGSRASRHQDDDVLPVVEPQRTVMIPSPAAAAQLPPASANDSRSRGGNTHEEATAGAPPPERSTPPSSPVPAPVHAALRSAGEPYPRSPSFEVAHPPIVAAPAASEPIAGRVAGSPADRPPGPLPRERRPGAVEVAPLRPARSVAESSRADAPGYPVRQLAADEPPVIRVTIGRVEVRAVNPPARPPAPPAPRPRQPSLSLGDYLAQRGEGRR
jgi:hypothetical protein